MDKEKRQKHPAYGLAVFSRTTGGTRKLFGSQVRCNSTIRLRIAEGEVIHSLGRDSYYGGHRPFVEVEFSPAQFAELLTTMNVGDGIPCTIRYREGKAVEGIPETDKTESEKVSDSFKENLSELAENLSEAHDIVEQLLNKKTLNKADKESIMRILSKAHQDVSSNLPFMMEQFNKSAQKVITQVKAEVDAFTTHAVQVAGLEAIAGGRMPNLMLENKKDEK